MGSPLRPVASHVLRKQPVQARADATLRAIYEAATRILQRDGLAGLSTGAVAAQAGYAVGTVYQYFRHKDAIVLALAMEELDRGAEAVARELDAAAGQPLEATLHAVVRAWMRSFAGRQRARRLVMQAVLERGAIAESHRRLADITEHVADRLAALPLPGLRPLTPAARFVLTRALIGALRAAVYEDTPLLRSRDFEDELVHLATGMLRP